MSATKSVTKLSIEDRKESRRTLLSLLKNNRDNFDIEYSESRFSNHLAHALTALYELKAPSSRLIEFYDKYSKKLEPKKPSSNFINKNNWSENTGLNEYYSDYLDFFLKEIRLKGRKYLINEYFPAMSHGVSGAAFHGLILLGYGIEADCDETVAEGMAYLAFCKTPLGTLSEQGEKKNPLQILQEVKTLPELSLSALFEQYHKEHNSYPGFQTRMNVIRDKYGDSLMKEFDLYMDENGNEEYVQYLLKTLSQLTCEGFANSGYRDFFMLHAVTSYRALKMVLRYLNRTSDKIVALKHYWRAFVCAYVAQGSIDVLVPEKFYNLPLSWANIIKPAINNDEVHLIKIVYVCKREEKEYGKVLDRDLYRDVAAKALALVEMYGFEFNAWGDE